MNTVELKQDTDIKTSEKTTTKDASQSQGKLIWRRYKRNKAGFIASIFLAIIVILVIFAGFLSPYSADEFHADANFINYDYVPPMIAWLKFDGLQPYVHGLQRTYNPLTGVKGYTESTDERYDVKWFVEGEPYLLFGFISTNIHLFGTGEPADSAGQLFLFGTDRFGRDVFSRILYGGQMSLGIGPLVVIFSFIIGIVLGGISGFYGGKVDNFLQRTVEVAMSLPRLALLLALSALLPPELPAEARFWGIAFILALVGWAPLARVIRGQVLALREEEFVQASHALGASHARMIFRHILPNTIGYLIVAATLAAPSVILLESVLSFFGFGLQEPLVSWGLLMNDLQGNFQTQVQFHPWLILPGVFIFISVLTFNLMGDALRDAVDPFTVVKGDS